ncbi:MAG: DUF559 domain-containing protein [Xenococcaceae cyanobacterium]
MIKYIGFKFHRQPIIERFIFNLYCHFLCLVIKSDCKIHNK